MALPTAPKPEFVESTETTITVEFAPLSDDTIDSYDVCWKEYPRNWEDGESCKPIPRSTFKGKEKATADAEDLNPGTTYAVRLVAKDGGGKRYGEPGPEIIVDTDAVGCGPKKRTCVVM